jgi:hypothetical protein
MRIEIEKEIEGEIKEAEIKSPFVKVIYQLEKFEKEGRALAKLLPKDCKTLTYKQKEQITKRVHKIFQEIKAAAGRPIKD